MGTVTHNEYSRLRANILNRIERLPELTAFGLLKGFSAALAVAERHAEDKGEKWIEQDAFDHLMHADLHINYTDDDGDELFHGIDKLDDDGLPHLDHACCRLLFAVAKREGM